MPRRGSVLTIPFALLVAFVAHLGWSQEFRSTISGRVIDAQQAVVARVKILATQAETGARYESVSAADGQFTLPFLPPGTYRLTAEASGFKRHAREGIQVSANARLGIDILLEVGALTESVTITAESLLLETTTASTGQVITTRQMETMPLNGRVPLIAAQLAFGVTVNSDPQASYPMDNAGPSNFSLGGAPNRTNELLIDGSPDSTSNSRVAYNPPVDTVQEVKVEVFQADAAYGHTGGGTVNVVLKGGTNQFRGSAYDFNQVAYFAATPFFVNRSGQKKPVGNSNQWGAGGGGPVMIPRLLDGRNKVFWYFAYEGVRHSLPEQWISTVPTPAERNGDFSALLGIGPQYQIYDPLTGVREGSRVRRQLFPNNVVPPNRIHSIAKAYLEFYPPPLQPGRADGQDNYVANRVTTRKFNNEIGRLDFNLSERHKFFYNFRHNESLEDRGNRFNNVATGNYLSRINFGSMMDDVYTFSPTTVLNTRFNWTRFTEGNSPPSLGFDFVKLGLPSYMAAASTRKVLPQASFSAFTSLGAGGGNVTPFDSFQIFSSLTKIRGVHSLKFGVDLRLYRESSAAFGNSSGSLLFGTDLTRGPLDNSAPAPLGQDLASFLLGFPSGGNFDVNTYRTNQAGYYALFLQDDYRVKSNLTLNLGLRFERDLATTERYNRSVNGFAFSTPSPIESAARAAYALSPIPEVPVSQFQVRGGLLFASPQDRNIYSTQSGYFSPRFGFAWTPRGPGGKTVLRGGAGVFAFPIVTTGVNQLGFSQSTQVAGSLDGGLTPFATLANPFPTGILQPTGPDLRVFLGSSAQFYNTAPLNPYSIRWTLNIQRELLHGTVFELGYIGNHSVHLALDRRLNFVPRQYLSALPTRDQAAIDRLTGNVSNPFQGQLPGTTLNGSSVQRQQLLLPFPQFTGVLVQSVNDGSSYFHAVQARLERRFSRGFQLLGSYQFSRLMEKLSRLNESDPFLEKRVSGDDHPHRVVINGVWELPFGKSTAVGGRAGSVLHRVIGDWVLNGIYTFQSGAALEWGNVIYLGGDLKWDPRNVDLALDVTRFNRIPAQQLASNIRTFPSRFSNLRQDGTNNVDCSIIKNFLIKESLRLQYRAEFFNTLNHPSFRAPQLSPTSSAFGTITARSTVERRTQMALRLTW